ncbi:hypothetical protein ABPG74_002256 [Tetrahymena malaccensis]
MSGFYVYSMTKSLINILYDQNQKQPQNKQLIEKRKAVYGISNQYQFQLKTKRLEEQMIQSVLKYLNEVYGKQKKYGFKIIESDSSQDTDRYIELENGDCVNIVGYNQGNRCLKNNIQSFQWTQLFYSIYGFFTRVQNIFLCITLLICISLDQENLPTAYNQSEIVVCLSIPLLLDIFVILFKEANYYSKQRKYDSQINDSNECQKLVRFKNAKFQNQENIEILQKVKWGNLQIGDIIFLKRDDYCPADILILDMWDQKCTIRTSFIDDQSKDSIKYAPLLTTISKGSSIKGNLLEYRRILSGRIDIKKTNDIYNFRGYLSLKKDPISEKFGSSNLIQKYSQIKFTDWMVGIVVLCGNDSYSFRKSAFDQKEKIRRNSSFFKRKWDLQSAIQILMICFFSIIVIILRISMVCFKSLQFKGQMIPIAIDFVFTFPLYYSVISTLCFILYTILSSYLFKMSDINLTQNTNFNLNFLNSYSEMTLSSHVIFNSFKIQNSKLKNVSTICLKDRYFKMNEENQSNQIIKSNNTIIRAKQSNTKNDMSDEFSLLQSPISSIQQKQNSIKINLGSNFSNPEGQFQNQSKRKKSYTNFNQTASSQVDDSPQNSMNGTQPSNGHNAPLSTFKKHFAKEKSPLSKIVELDSKSVIPLDNESQKDRDDIQNDIVSKLGSKNDLKSQKSLKKKTINKADSLIEFDDQSNFQTFAENFAIEDVPVKKKLDSHATKRNVSITQLNITENNTSYDNTITAASHRKIFDQDATFNNISQRGLLNDADLQQQKMLPSVSQNNSPKNKKLMQQQQMQNSNTPFSNSKNLHDHTENDALTFMKGSFAPIGIMQNYSSIVKGRSGSQCDSSLVQKNSSIKENTQKNPMLFSFDIVSFQEKDILKKQDQRSPSKINYHQSLLSNGNNNMSSFGYSPRWKNPSMQNVINVNQNKNVNIKEFQNDIFQNNTEQSQQVNIELSQSQQTIQVEGRNHELKSYSNENLYNHINFKNNHFDISPNKFKTYQTGQPLQKSIIDNFQEIEIRSESSYGSDSDSDNQDIIYQQFTQEDNSKNYPLYEPSYNNLISKQFNTSAIEPTEKSFRKTEENYEILKSNSPNQRRISEHKNSLKVNGVSHDNKEIESTNKKIVNGNIENLNLLSSEIESTNVNTKVDKIFDELQNSNQNNLHNLQSSQYQEDNLKNKNGLFLSEQKFIRLKKQKSFTNKENTNIDQNKENQNEISNFQETQDELNPKNLIFHSGDQANQSKIALMRGVTVNPLIQRFKQTNHTTIDDINSAESLQKRLSVSSMLPSSNTIFQKQPESFRNLSGMKKSNNPQFENQQGFTKSLVDKNKNAKELLLAMTVCHDSKTKGDRLKMGENVTHIHFDDDTQYILDFAKSHNFNFECSCFIQDQNYYIIKTEEGQEKFQVLQRFQSLSNKKLITIVQNHSDFILYIKDYENFFPDYLVNSVSNEKKQKLENLIQKIVKQGEKIIFYSKIILTESQVLDLTNAIRLETSQEKIQLIYKQLIQQKSEEPSDIQMLGFIGLQEESDLLIHQMIKDLRGFGQKIWVLTSDTQQSTLESCYNYSVLQDNGMELVDFSSSNFDELFYKTRNHLQNLKKILQKQVKSQNNNNMGISQSVFDNNQKDNTPTLTNVKNEMLTPVTPNSQNNQKLPIDRKSTFADLANSSKKVGLVKMQSQQNIPKKAAQTFLGIEESTPINISASNNAQIINNNQESKEMNYYVLISGESLNTIRNNSYLWDHFCLIAFFANGVVGYEITDEQKCILGQVITTRFHKSSSNVVNIVSSLNDIESLNFEQISVYLRSQSDKNSENQNQIISQHADLNAKDALSFLNILTKQSRLQSEIVEETIYLAIHRSYLMSLAIIVWNIYTCACNYPLFTPYQTIIFHGIQYMISFFFYLIRKKRQFNKDNLKANLPGGYLYNQFINLKSQYSRQQLPILNLKVIISSVFDTVFIFMYFMDLYNFQNGMEIDIETLRCLLQWGISIASFCRVFDLYFIRFDKFTLVYVLLFSAILEIQTLIHNGGEVGAALFMHTFKKGYILNFLLFLFFCILKNLIETTYIRTAPRAIVGFSKYIVRQQQQQQQQQLQQQKSQKKKNSIIELKSVINSNKTSKKQLSDNAELDNKIQEQPINRQEQISPQQKDNKTIYMGNNNLLNLQKSEYTSMNSISTPPAVSQFDLKNLTQKINPAQIIRSIFKDKEMDIILSQMLMQEEINITSTQMQKFTLRFQIREIERLFIKGWELLIPNSNRIFYVINFIAFDIAYDVLVLSKVTNEFSSADGGYIITYAITASTIFIFTALSLTKYYQKSNILIFSSTLVIVRSIKFILLSIFKQIIIYPTELIMHIAVASSCLRFSHHNVLIQGLILFFSFIVLTETNIKQWNLQRFLNDIGYVYEGSQGYQDSIYIVRICFYISFFIILAQFVATKYNMIFTIRTNYLSEHNLFKATLKVKDILSILLPKFIREKIETMKQGQYRVAEKQDEVIIVFCDICNFDDIIFNEKINTVKILDKLYRQFDLACQQNGLQKIETVGKTYLAAAGITDVEKLLKAEGRLQDVSPAKRALQFAFDLQRIVRSKQLYLASNKKIIIKVGIHLGPAISGVIGYHKPQFSLIGDTVNTTSRVCSTGLSDHIIISKEVYDKVYQLSQYKFQQRDVEAKGKGIMTTFQVFDKRHIRNNASKKQTLNFLDDTAITNNQNTNPTLTSNLSSVFQIGSGIHNFLSSHNQIHQITLENSSEKNTQEQSNQIKKNNSNKFIPLKSIPESPNNYSNASQVQLRDQKLNLVNGDDTNCSIKQNLVQPLSDQLIQKSTPSNINLRIKNTSFGGALEDLSQKQKTGGSNQEIGQRRRMLKKSSSMTVVNLKPRFKNDSVQSNQNKISGSKEENIDEQSSPLAPSRNEFIRQIEKDLMQRIELEPVQIQMKELTLPLEKIKMHINHQDHGGDKSLASSRDEVGNSHSSHLRLGICSTNSKSTAEQKQLHTEFLKQIMKQQIPTIIAWMCVISLYYLIKSGAIIYFINNKGQLQLSQDIQLNLTIFILLMPLLFLPLACTFRKLHNYLSWKNMRIFIYGIYFLSLAFQLIHNIFLDKFMNEVTKYNLNIEKIDKSYQASVNSVTAVILPSTLIYVMELQFIFIFFTTFKALYFMEKVGAMIVQVVTCFLYITFKNRFDVLIIFFVALVGIIHLRIQYNHMQNEVRNFNNLKTLESKKDELDSLLKNLLPAHILDTFLNSMKKEIPLICEELHDVTLLFADIAGFTKYSSTTDPIVVVNMLRRLFTDFDDHCLNQNVYKLYTIGDCYVCFGLTNKNERNPAQEAHNVVRFAFDMIRIIENVRQYTDCNLQMRIGIHTGKLYGGIVGTEIVRYDIYGQDVIIANKMESNGESGHVMVSETTKKLLEDHFPNEFIFDFKEHVHIKQTNKDIDGFLIRFNQNTSVYYDNSPES